MCLYVCGEPLVIWGKRKISGVTFMFLFYVSLFAQQIFFFVFNGLAFAKGWKVDFFKKILKFTKF
jgi:hypothetical protein